MSGLPVAGAINLNRMLRIVCAWCGTTIRDGNDPASHGICAACDARLEDEQATDGE
jgi:hypothetical protein